MQKHRFIRTLLTTWIVISATVACNPAAEKVDTPPAEPTTELTPRARILAEGILLYQLEITSWKSTEILKGQQASLLAQIDGYLSYPRTEGGFSTIFLRGTDLDRIVATVTFADLYQDEPSQVDMEERLPTDQEQMYIDLRLDALERSKDESFFVYYDHTVSNLVPIVHQGERRVYLLTSSALPEHFFFGNDYLLEYDNNGNFVRQEKLHQDIAVVDAKSEAVNGVVGTTHTHGARDSEYITPTDVCLLLLYGEYTNWNQHYVLSDTQVSIWDLRRQDLVIKAKADFAAEGEAKQD